MSRTIIRKQCVYKNEDCLIEGTVVQCSSTCPYFPTVDELIAELHKALDERNISSEEKEN